MTNIMTLNEKEIEERIGPEAVKKIRDAALDLMNAAELNYQAIAARTPKPFKSVEEWAIAASKNPDSERIRWDATATLSIIAALRKAGSVLV